MKRILQVSLFTLYICVVTQLTAQRITDANITGHVVDKSTGEHIPYASVIIKDINKGVYTDSTGHYMLNNLPTGSHVVNVIFMGYKNLEQQIFIERGKTYVLHFSLEPDTDVLDEVVVTGNRYATKKRETGTIVNVLSPAKFETTSAINPAGVLDFQPGARVEYNCGNCGVPQLKINGLSGQYTQVLLDSRPIFSSLGMVYGLEQLPSSMIERIETVRGGGSALFGSNAIGGTVNIITKEPSAALIQLANQSGLIGFKALDMNTSLNGSVVSQDYKTGAYLFSMVRKRDAYDYNGDGYSDIPKLNGSTVGVRAYHKINKDSKITAEYHHIYEFRRGGDSLHLPPHQTNLTEQIEHNIDGGGLNYDIKFDKNSANIYASAQHISRNSYFGTDRNDSAYGKTKDITVNAGMQWLHDFFKLWFMPSKLTAGIDYTYNNLFDKMLGYGREINQNTNLIGSYLQNEWNNEKVGILLGVRVDKHSMVEKPIISPRINLRYAFDGSWTVRMSYARGYRAPQTYDEDLHVGAVGGEVALINVADNLRPEYSNTLNLSFDYWKIFGKWQLNILAEGFYTNLSDVFTLIENGHDKEGNLLLLRTNSSGAKIEGVNAEMRFVNNGILNLQLGYTIQSSRYKEPFSWSEIVAPQKKMLRAPDNYGYFTMDYYPFQTVTLSLSGTYTGKMLVNHYAGVAVEDQENTTSRFFDIGFRGAYLFNISNNLKIEFSLSCKNIFNSYQNDLDLGANKDSKYIYGPLLPRSCFFGMKIML